MKKRINMESIRAQLLKARFENHDVISAVA